MYDIRGRQLLLTLLSGVLVGCVSEVGGGTEPGTEWYGPNGSGRSTLTIAGSPGGVTPDTNVKLRGWAEVGGERALIDVNGPTDARAPKLNTLFADRRVPAMSRLFKVGVYSGVANGVEGQWPVHLLEFQTRPGEQVRLPESGYSIGDGRMALVLFADSDSLTLKYTREDSVVTGYTIHLVGLSVDPGLRSLYDSCHGAGRQELPALSGGEPLGSAKGALLVSIRDTGQFMDPRARKDWYDGSGPVEPPPSSDPAPSDPAPSDPAPPDPPPSDPPPSDPAPSDPAPSDPAPSGSCPCDAGVDNFCHYLPGTAGCAMTAPGGYCDPDGDGSYSDADWARGYNEYQTSCGGAPPTPPPPSDPPPSDPPPSDPPPAGSCPCDGGGDNFCHYLPSTAGCPMTAPGGYCDPNGDGSYSDADWVRGYNEYHAQCP